MATPVLSAEATDIMGALTRAHRLSTALSRRLTDELGCTRQQAETLAAIEDGAVRLNEVAQATGQHLSGASRLIDTLVTDGLVDRHPDPHDRRAIVLALTHQGADLLEQARTLIGRIVDAALQQLPAQHRAMLPALLAEFLTAAEITLDHHDSA